MQPPIKLQASPVGASEPRNSEAGFFCPAYVGLRCVLLMAVLQGHYWFEATSDSRVHPLTFAVPCFFALSGYLISHTLFAYEHKPWKEGAKVFYLRRALRILPPFYLVLLIAYLWHGIPYLAWQASYLMNFKIYLLSAYEPAYFAQYLRLGDVNAIHFWSVDVEEQFYLLYPLFVAATHRRGRTAWLLGAIALSVACRAYFYETQYATFYGGLTPVAGEFILWGCLLAWWDHRGKLVWLRNSVALYGSLGLFLLLVTHDQSYGPWAQWKPPHHQSVYAILLAVFLLSLRYSSQSWLAWLLSRKPLAVIGQMSYGAYLIHAFCNPIVDALLAEVPSLILFERCPRAVAGPLVTLAAAALLWYGFERPIDSIRRRYRPRS